MDISVNISALEKSTKSVFPRPISPESQGFLHPLEAKRGGCRASSSTDSSQESYSSPLKSLLLESPENDTKPMKTSFKSNSALPSKKKKKTKLVKRFKNGKIGKKLKNKKTSIKMKKTNATDLDTAIINSISAANKLISVIGNLSLGASEDLEAGKKDEVDHPLMILLSAKSFGMVVGTKRRKFNIPGVALHVLKDREEGCFLFYLSHKNRFQKLNKDNQKLISLPRIDVVDFDVQIDVFAISSTKDILNSIYVKNVNAIHFGDLLCFDGFRMLLQDYQVLTISQNDHAKFTLSPKILRCPQVKELNKVFIGSPINSELLANMEVPFLEATNTKMTTDALEILLHNWCLGTWPLKVWKIESDMGESEFDCAFIGITMIFSDSEDPMPEEYPFVVLHYQEREYFLHRKQNDIIRIIREIDHILLTTF